jgi:ketosteroid isomerase-like protein
MGMLDADAALALVERAHEAWANGDFETTLSCYVDDMVHITNTAGNGEPFILNGKEAFRARFEPVMQVVDSKTFIIDFRFFETFARIRFQTYMKHRATGFEYNGVYREICTFRGDKIEKIEDFHDAARMAAFWRMVEEIPTAAAK